MNTGVLWEDIQVGKLYTPFITVVDIGYLKLEQYLNINKHHQDIRRVRVRLEAGEPIMVLSRYYEQELKRGWIRILKEDKTCWIPYENSFKSFQTSEEKVNHV
jgi:hypothetical protein